MDINVRVNKEIHEKAVNFCVDNGLKIGKLYDRAMVEFLARVNATPNEPVDLTVFASQDSQ